jgi:hypothetical protein
MLAACAAALLMTACGGDDDVPIAAAPPAPVAPVVVGSASGSLIDASVGGVSYTTSSGVKGTTAADGSYNFNPGDTVTFTLGGLTLGTATATGIISPMELSAGEPAGLAAIAGLRWQSGQRDHDSRWLCSCGRLKREPGRLDGNLCH